MLLPESVLASLTSSMFCFTSALIRYISVLYFNKSALVYLIISMLYLIRAFAGFAIGILSLTNQIVRLAILFVSTVGLLVSLSSVLLCFTKPC